jgi:hypothetical protein
MVARRSAARVGVPLPGLGEEFCDQVRFACDIGSAVCPEQWGELVLELGVTSGLARMRAQEVPQVHVIAMCLAAVGDDIEVVIDRARCGRNAFDRQPRGGSSGVGRNTLTDASVHRPISASQMISRSHPARPARGG